MSSLLRFGALCVLLAGVLIEPGQVRGDENHTYAKVYSAKIDADPAATLADLERIARERGSVELLTFPTDGNPCEADTRELMRRGDPGVAYYGFSVRARELLAKQRAAGRVATDNSGRTATSSIDIGGNKIDVRWGFPEKPGTPLSVTYTAQGKTIIETTIHPANKARDAFSRPRLIRTAGLLGGGAEIIQVYEYLDARPAFQSPALESFEPSRLRGARKRADTAVTDSDTRRQSSDASPLDVSDSVDFGGNDGVCLLGGLSLDWDTDWQPNPNEDCEPLQVRLHAGLGSDVCADVEGDFSLDGASSSLQVGSGSGFVEIDFGAELDVSVKVCINMPFPIPDLEDEFPVPFVPNFDLRAADQEIFSSFLLDGCATASDDTGRQNLLDLDITDLLAPIPNLGAGLAIDAAISASGTMCGESIGVTGGNTFTSEGESQTVSVGCQGYSETASYNESFMLDSAVTLYPTLFVEIPGHRWELPIMEFTKDTSSLALDVPFSSSGLSFSADHCGNGACDCGEDCNTCQSDCPPVCGDSTCECGETRDNCCDDCAQCGDRTCDSNCGEDCNTCLADCPPACGDGTCECGETRDNCCDDCAQCGDGTCDSNCGEDCNTCQSDCPPVCGDGTCECGETRDNCCDDCAQCGDGTCDSNCGEDGGNCPEDCALVNLMTSKPLDQGTLWRSQKNIARLTFDGDLPAAPAAGQVEINELLPAGALGPDLSPSFTFGVEGGTVLRIQDTGATLEHRKWYAIRNVGGWGGVANFEIQYLLQMGDCDGNGVVISLDVGAINSIIPCVADCGDDNRMDVDGDGQVITLDVGAVNVYIGSFWVPKPDGH